MSSAPVNVFSNHPAWVAAYHASLGTISYVIVFSIRCGSTLLCEDITLAGLGAPAEYFQGELGYPLEPFLGYSPTDFCDYLGQLLDGAPNRIFGFKLGWYQAYTIQWILRHPYHTESDLLLSAIFPDRKVIYNVRQDKVLQAVSSWRAEQTGLWHQRNGPGVASQARAPRPPYDFPQLKLKFSQILGEDWIWRKQFAALGLDPLTITYEDHVANRIGAVRQVANLLGRELPPGFRPSDSLVRLADDYSLDLKARFLRDLRTSDHILLDRFEQHFTFSDS